MKTNTRTWKTIAILGHFFGTGIVEAKFPDEIEELVHWSLFGGPSNMSYQLSISECCCASLYGKLYIKMLEASNDPILEFSGVGGYTFNFKEIEREREIWSILTPITRVNTRSAQAKTLCKIDELVSIWVSFKPELSILESCGPRCLAV